MKLRYSPSSPYARKARAAVRELGLAGRVEEIFSNPWDADTDLPTVNPAGKIPVLILDDGTTLYDSPVICEYLDSLSDRATLFPPPGPARWTALRRQATADALLDAMIARRQEGNRPADKQMEYWIERHWSAVQRCLDEMERSVPDAGKPVDIGDIATVCALGQLDFRFGDRDWRPGRPKLAAWYAAMMKRPALADTQVHDH